MKNIVIAIIDLKVIITILTVVLCAVVVFSLYPKNNITDKEYSVSSSNTTSSTTFFNSKKRPVIEQKIVNMGQATATSSTGKPKKEKEEEEKEENIESVPFPNLDVIPNSDGTITLTEDIEIIFTDGVVFNIMAGAIVENGDTIRTGLQGGEIVYADGYSYTLPVGFIIEILDDVSDDHINIMDIINNSENPGCSNTNTITPKILALLLFLIFNGRDTIRKKKIASKLKKA
jgi:hypothetical protein